MTNRLRAHLLLHIVLSVGATFGEGNKFPLDALLKLGVIDYSVIILI